MHGAGSVEFWIKKKGLWILMFGKTRCFSEGWGSERCLVCKYWYEEYFNSSARFKIRDSLTLYFAMS